MFSLLAFPVWTFLLHLSYAVYNDEAFHVDWQIENLGRIKCIDKLNLSLVVLSESLSGSSVVSFLDSATGFVQERIELEEHVEGIRAVDGTVVLGNGYSVDMLNGLQFKSSTDEITCRKPALSHINVEGNELFIMLPTSGAQVLMNLPESFKQVEYFSYVPETGTVEIVISTEDSLYQYNKFENGVVTDQWERDESRFNIVAYAVYDELDDELDLTREEFDHEQTMSITDAYKHRVQTNFEKLKNYLIRKKFNLGRIASDLLSDHDVSALMGRDLLFGFTKQLIVASKSGVISSLDIRTGKKLWSVSSNLDDIHALQISNSHELLVITSNKIFFIDLTTSAYDLQHKTSAPAGFHYESDAEASFIKLVNDNDASFTIVTQPEETFSNLSYVHYDEHSIKGFIASDGDIKSTWGRSLSSHETVVSYSTRKEEAVSSLGVILGNRTVLYKYLNPNVGGYLIADDSDKSLVLEIIDTVTGQLLHSARHMDNVDFSHPIDIEIGEHWCVYSYFSQKPIPEQKLAVVEFYESLTPDERMSKPEQPFNSLKDELKPKVISNSYFYPQPISSMTLSKTKFGITSRSLVLQMDDGSINYIPKYIISARRKPEDEMSKTDKEEFMASAYEPTIPVNDHFLITHFRKILGSKNFQLFSVPTKLESTSIVCSIGNDLFCTRISPSSQFDKLGVSFEKTKVLATLVGLLIICYFLRPMVEQRKLKIKWLVKDLDITSL